MKILKLEGGWNLSALVDDDNHLTVWISNNDKSLVHRTDEDPIVSGEREYSIELTTEFLEKIHMENLA
jgi:hypothetical protein